MARCYARPGSRPSAAGKSRLPPRNRFGARPKPVGRYSCWSHENYFFVVKQYSGLARMPEYLAGPLDQDCAVPSLERLIKDLYGTRARRHDQERKSTTLRDPASTAHHDALEAAALADGLRGAALADRSDGEPTEGSIDSGHARRRTDAALRAS